MGPHASQRVTRDLVAGADLVLGMARTHVREAAVLGPGMFAKTFTLKEFVRRASGAGARDGGETMPDYLARVGEGRTPSELMGDDPDDDVADPIGMDIAVYRDTAGELDQLVSSLVRLVWAPRTRDEPAAAARVSRADTALHGTPPRGTEARGTEGVEDQRAGVAPSPNGAGRVAVGSDHGGYALKTALAAHLVTLGFVVEDLGTDGNGPVDYPDFGAAVGRAVSSGRVDFGVCVCGTGIGISIAANKVPGVRAALVHDVTTARLARQHNDANVVCFGERTTGVEVATEALDVFVATPWSAESRHARRVAKLGAMDGAG
jgi:ribose 5-phosphate isomerase B